MRNKALLPKIDVTTQHALVFPLSKISFDVSFSHLEQALEQITNAVQLLKHVDENGDVEYKHDIKEQSMYMQQVFRQFVENTIRIHSTK
ncbi:MAG: hypothetical protein HC819_16955 [Cyclobacteriaceae bacterium]|nr:hypothetical protein [Cyclobacteriaceae bacterium]